MDRNPFFSEDELVLLLKLVKKYPQINSTRIDQTAVKDKAAAWLLITEEFNEVNPIFRDINCLKVKFRGVKSKYKWRKAAEKREIERTGRKPKPAQTGRKSILCDEAQTLLDSILKDLDEGVFEDIVFPSDVDGDLDDIPQEQLVEYDPDVNVDVDVDIIEENEPYLIEYLEEEIPYPKSPQNYIEKEKTPPRPVKKELEVKTKKLSNVEIKSFKTTNNVEIKTMKPPNVVETRVIKPSNNVDSKNQKISKVVETRNLKTPNSKPSNIVEARSIRKDVVLKPIIKKEPERAIKRTVEKPQQQKQQLQQKQNQQQPQQKPPQKQQEQQKLTSETRRNPPRDISKRRYTTSQLDEYFDSDSVPDESEFKIKKRRLTSSQQKQSLLDSLGGGTDEEEGMQLPTSTSPQKSDNKKRKRNPSSDDEGNTIQIKPPPSKPRPLPSLAEAQAEYFRDKNIREEKKEQREAEEHKLKMKKLWLEIRKTMLEVNSLESDNMESEQ